jgi:hypothetical protein
VTPSPVYLEEGAKSVFAVSLDWPGWCRRPATADGALDHLDRYRDRYDSAVGGGFDPGSLEVIRTVPGDRTTDFGAPDAREPSDEEALTFSEFERQVGLLGACWTAFDLVVANAPEALRKGPRGGGRDRDAIADYVGEAERAYGRKIGAPVPPRTEWSDQRAAIAAALFAAPSGTPWPIRYAIRRLAWHLLDHAWEIEDKRT